MTDEKSFTVDKNGTLVVEINGIDHEYSLDDGDEVVVSWHPI